MPNVERHIAVAVDEGDRRTSLHREDMTLTGQDGINFLAQCEAADIALANCDPCVRGWITRQMTGT